MKAAAFSVSAYALSFSREVINSANVLLITGCWVSWLNRQIFTLPSLGSLGWLRGARFGGKLERARAVMPKPC